MNRTLLIIIVAILLVGGAAGVYFYFFAGNPGVTVTPSGTTTLPSAGQGTTPESGAGDTAATGVSGTPVKISARLVQIDQGPVVPGEAITEVAPVSTTSSPDMAVHYIKRESGNVYSYLITAGTLTRTSNRTVPGIEDATWLPDASAAFVRFLSGADFGTVNTYRLPSDGSAGTMLAANISEIQTASSTILTLVSGQNGSLATISNLDGTKSSKAFSTPLSSIRTQIVGANYLVYTKPNQALDGYAFLVDKNGNFKRIAGPLKGLVALASPGGKWIVVSYVSGNTLKMELVAGATGAVTALPVATIADKCVWTADESSVYCGVPVNPDTTVTYPDDWYQGAVHFSDRIWKIDVQGRYASLVLDFSKEAKSDLDATALTVDTKNQDLVFLNKNDSSLWIYQL